MPSKGVCPICGRMLSRVWVRKIKKFARDCPSCPYSEYEEPTGTECPYCGFDAQGNVQTEVAHMNAVHPDVVAERLRKAGIHPNEL